MWDASLVSLPMFTDGIATKWASHIHRGLTVYSEQSLFRHSFYHSINISCTFPLFLTAWIYISHTSSIDTYISITLQRKKSSCDFCGKNKVIVALLYSIKPTVTTNFKYVPRSSKASFSCCCWKQSFCSSCSSSISWSLPNGSMSNSSSLSCEIWGSDTKKSPWMISFQKVPTHKILTGTRVIFHKDYFVNFELNWVQLLTPFNE